ncbi:MAG: hypothetical protein EOO52_10135 [Gammaproteobacteria bacterium]|nr:MAG: hypothetical protein EOO52_10135 [Gammaproteobacteria bacterium]
MLKNIFGENYKNRNDLFSSLYFRIIFIRGVVFDFPLIVFIFYLIPWGDFYETFLIKKIVFLMESYIYNISANRVNSDFPEYAVTYLSVVHLLGLILLFFPFFTLRRSQSYETYFKKNKINKVKILFCGVISSAIFFFGNIFSGAISYFGCHDCSYHHKFSLIIGAVVGWVCVHYSLTMTIVFYKTIIFIRRSELR